MKTFVLSFERREINENINQGYILLQKNRREKDDHLKKNHARENGCYPFKRSKVCVKKRYANYYLPNHFTMFSFEKMQFSLNMKYGDPF